jgi:LysM repeat protein
VDYLTQAFIWNYERPARSAGQDSTPDRIAFAQKCFDTLSFTGGGTVSPSPRHATTKVLPQKHQQATTYKVKPGDSLLTLAKKFNTKWDAIARLNPDIKPPYYVIYAGQVLKIPGAAKVTVPEKRYVVRKGDSLSLICRKLGVTQSLLITKNKISNPNKIFIGQVLKY